MRHSNRELWLSFIATLAITGLYLYMVVTQGSIPAAREFFGHSLGILGFIMMLMTEILYSRRKRSRSARWGKMSSWLQFHIFTGLVGPYMVLLHSSWKFNGLAGIVTLLTLVVVASGFIGRYIYTAIPRTADGVEVESDDLERQTRVTETELQGLLAGSPALEEVVAARFGDLLDGSARSGGGWGPFREWARRWRWWRLKRELGPDMRGPLSQLERLAARQRLLRRQVASLVIARRMLALWHVIHIPFGLALFTAAFIHIGAAMYFATLLR